MARRIIVLNGCCGVGKTTVGQSLSDMMQDEGVAHVVFDLDAVSNIHPKAADDPFGTLHALHVIGAGLKHVPDHDLILSGVIETPADHSAVHALAPAFFVLLTAPSDVIEERLAQREHGGRLAWHVERARTLNLVLQSAPVADLTLDASTANPRTLAKLIYDATR